MKLLILLLLVVSFSSLQSKIITQTGYWDQHFSVADITNYQVSKSPLAYKFPVSFPIAFRDYPVVALALNIFHLEVTDPGIRVEAQDISKTGFNVYVEIQDNAYVYHAGAQWMATIDQRISVSYISKNSANEPHLPTSDSQPGLKEFNVRLLHPVPLNKPKVDVFMAGFGFGGKDKNNTLKFDTKNLDQNGVNVVYSTWDDTVLKAAAFYLISYEDDPTFFQNTTQTPYETKSKLWDFNKNPEIRYDLRYLDIGNDTEGTLLGLQQIEFNATSDLLLEVDHRRNGDTVEVKYLTRGTTSIRFVKTSLLVIPMLDSIVEPTKTYTQTGLIGKNFAGDGHPFATDDSQDRFIVYRATYPQRFRKTPNVMIGAVGFEMTDHYPGFQIDVISTSPTDFTIKMTVRKGTILKSFQAGWLATISPNLRITQFYHELTADELATKPDPKTGLITYTFPYQHPRPFETPGVGLAFNGFQFNGVGHDIQLAATYTDLSKDGFNLVVTTNQKSQLTIFSLIVMHLEASEKRNAYVVPIPAIQNGETKDAKAQVFSNAEFFVGLTQLDFEYHGDFEFKQDFFIKGSEFTARVTAGSVARINSLTDTILVVPHSKVQVRLFNQQGRFEKWYKDSKSDFLLNSTYDRTETYEIVFDTKFDQIPDVAVSFTGFDIDGQGVGLNVEVVIIYASKFQIKVTAYNGTVVNSIELSWIATVSDEITVGYVSFDAATDANFNSTFSKPGNRYRNFVIDPNGVEFDNPGAQVALTGFKFGNGSAPVVYSWVRDVNHAGANIIYGTFGDTVIEKLKFVVIQYEKNNKNRGILLESKYQTNLWKWSGQRSEYVDAKNLGTGGLYWFGISGFDFQPDHTYKMHQELTTDEDDGTMTIGIKVWGRTKVSKVTNSVFHTIISE